MVYAADSKSAAFTGLRVQVSSPALFRIIRESRGRWGQVPMSGRKQDALSACFSVFSRCMALLDPRLIEIEILSEAERKTFAGGGPYEYRRGESVDREREAALLELMAARAIVYAKSYDHQNTGDPEFAIDNLASFAVTHLLLGNETIIPLKITQRGRLRLARLRDEILSGRDRIRDQFGVLWDHRHWLPDLTVRLRSREPRSSLSLIVLDVDRLKELNADLGHAGADKVLTGIFEELRDVVRPQESYRTGDRCTGRCDPDGRPSRRGDQTGRGGQASG